MLIPARNEQDGIARPSHRRSGSQGVDLEVIVLDDHSEDATAAVVNQLAAADSRVRLVRPLQNCRKAGAASNTRVGCWLIMRGSPLLGFLDADVRLCAKRFGPNGGIFLRHCRADLASGISASGDGRPA